MTTPCQHHVKARHVGYAETRRIAGYTCTLCGETDITRMLPAPVVQSVNPHELRFWESGQDEQKITSIMDAYRHGCKVPPILTNSAGSALYDGHHRAIAARRLNVGIDAICIPMGWGCVGSRLPDIERVIEAFEAKAMIARRGSAALKAATKI